MDREELLAEVLREYHREVEAGRQPALESWLARYP
jgi:hypothetical protein